MTTLNDEILRATGGPTVNEGLAAYFGKLAGETLQDAEARWLLSDPVVDLSGASSNQDMWYVFLRSHVPPGSLNDMKLAYWSAEPVMLPIPPVAILDMSSLILCLTNQGWDVVESPANVLHSNTTDESWTMAQMGTCDIHSISVPQEVDIRNCVNAQKPGTCS